MTKISLPHWLFLSNDEHWFDWCEENIGLHPDNWHWADEPSGFFIYLSEMDAIAFKIRFGL